MQNPSLFELCAVFKDVVAAIKEDNATSVRIALDCGLDPGSRYNESASPLFRNTGDTLLHWAARYDSGDSAKACKHPEILN